MSEVTEHVAVANKGVLSLLSKRLSPLDGPLALEDEIPFLFYGGGEPPSAQPLTGHGLTAPQRARRSTRARNG
jgi:hypothetical protein